MSVRASRQYNSRSPEKSGEREEKKHRCFDSRASEAVRMLSDTLVNRPGSGQRPWRRSRADLNSSPDLGSVYRDRRLTNHNDTRMVVLRSGGCVFSGTLRIQQIELPDTHGLEK